MTKSIILLSGGLDSVVSLASSIKTHNITMALTFDYGQKASSFEINAAQKIAEFYNIEHKIIALPWLKNITQTSLVNTQVDTPKPTLDDLDNFEKSTQSAKSVWIPNRNGLFINIAASFCDSFGYEYIIFGANKEEATTFPDNSAEFIEKMNATLEFSTLAQPKIFAPLIDLDKAKIIKKGAELNVPFELIRSCYQNQDNHCGKCESCLRLRRGLDKAGLKNVVKMLFE